MLLDQQCSSLLLTACPELQGGRLQGKSRPGVENISVSSVLHSGCSSDELQERTLVGDHQKIRVLVREVLQATPIRDDITQLHLPGRHETSGPLSKSDAEIICLG